MLGVVQTLSLHGCGDFAVFDTQSAWRMNLLAYTSFVITFLSIGLLVLGAPSFHGPGEFRPRFPPSDEGNRGFGSRFSWHNPDFHGRRTSVDEERDFRLDLSYLKAYTPSEVPL